jgi:hypothetical protein
MVLRRLGDDDLKALMQFVLLSRSFSLSCPSAYGPYSGCSIRGDLADDLFDC